MISVKYVPNLFEDHCFEMETHNLSLASILLSFCRKYPEIKQDGAGGLTIRVNGKKISPFQWSKTILKDGDRVLIVQEVGDFLGLSLVAIAAFWGTTTTALTTFFTVAYAVASIAYTIYSYVSAPSPNKPKNALDSSPTYDWDGARLTSMQATPIPVVYGEHRMPGHVTGGEQL